MQTYIALLRGINVGKANRIAMADLRELLGKLGYADARTLLNSGNAIFRGPDAPGTNHAAAIRAAIMAKLELDIPVIVKSATELDDIVHGCAAAASAPDPSRLLVAFVPDNAALSRLEQVADLVSAGEWFLIGDVAAYLHCGNGVLESKAAVALLGKGKAAVTTRNWATVLKIQALVHAEDA